MNYFKKTEYLYRSRKLWFSAFFLVLTFITKAQFLEFGAGIGVTSYNGDLVKGLVGKSFRPGFNIYHRMNMSNVVAIRYNLTSGVIAGNDSKPIDALGSIRNHDFSARVTEASINFEYFFLDYLNKYSSVKWSPYFSLGVGFYGLSNYQDNAGGSIDSPLRPVLPIGVGFKHLLGKRFAASLDFNFKKTFADNIDGISDADHKFQKSENAQFGNPSDQDWYTYFGISLSYIIYKIPCPFRYIPNESILK